MIGTPGETDADVDECIAFTAEILAHRPAGARNRALLPEAQHPPRRGAVRGHRRRRGPPRPAAPWPAWSGRRPRDERALGVGRIRARAGGRGRGARRPRRRVQGGVLPRLRAGIWRHRANAPPKAFHRRGLAVGCARPAHGATLRRPTPSSPRRETPRPRPRRQGSPDSPDAGPRGRARSSSGQAARASSSSSSVRCCPPTTGATSSRSRAARRSSSRSGLRAPCSPTSTRSSSTATSPPATTSRASSRRSATTAMASRTTTARARSTGRRCPSPSAPRARFT